MSIHPVDSTSQFTLSDYIPVISTVRGIYQIFHKNVSPQEERSDFLMHLKFSILSGTKTWRSFVIIIPLIGNLIVLTTDLVNGCRRLLHNSTNKNEAVLGTKLPSPKILPPAPVQPTKEPVVIEPPPTDSSPPNTAESTSVDSVQNEISFPFDTESLSILQKIETLNIPTLQPLLDEIKTLEQKKFIHSASQMKEAKDLWEHSHNTLFYEQEIKIALGESPDENISKLLSIADRQLKTVSEKLALLKKEKHTLEAGSVKNSDEIIRLARQGNIEKVKAFIKLGQESQSIQGVKKGPVPESQEAKIISKILAMSQQVSISIDMNTKKFVVLDKGTVICDDFQALLLNVVVPEKVPSRKKGPFPSGRIFMP